MTSYSKRRHWCLCLYFCFFTSKSVRQHHCFIVNSILFFHSPLRSWKVSKNFVRFAPMNVTRYSIVWSTSNYSFKTGKVWTLRRSVQLYIWNGRLSRVYHSTKSSFLNIGNAWNFIYKTELCTWTHGLIEFKCIYNLHIYLEQLCSSIGFLGLAWTISLCKAGWLFTRVNQAPHSRANFYRIGCFMWKGF